MIRIGLPAALLRIAIFLAAPDSPRMIVELEAPPVFAESPGNRTGMKFHALTANYRLVGLGIPSPYTIKHEADARRSCN